MKLGHLGLVGMLAATVALSGCASENMGVCDDFIALTDDVDAKITELAGRNEWVTPETAAEWDEVAKEVDRLGVRADGIIQDRLLGVVENWPRFDSLVHGTAADPFRDRWVSVARACNA